MVAVAEMEWQDMVDGNFPDTPARQAFREAVATVADSARAALPESNGRIEKAIALMLAGDVNLHADGSATVGSQTSTKTYTVTHGACDCTDYAKSPQQQCKHRISLRHSQTGHRPCQSTGAGHSISPPGPSRPKPSRELTPAPRRARQPFPPGHSSKFRGKTLVKYRWFARTWRTRRAWSSLSAHFISVTETLALAEATAEFTSGQTFSECADAGPASVNPKVAKHFARISLTRAKARCLRDALNLAHLVALEEASTMSSPTVCALLRLAAQRLEVLAQDDDAQAVVRLLRRVVQRLEEGAEDEEDRRTLADETFCTETDQ